MSRGSNKDGSGVAWVVGIVIFVALLAALGQNDSSSSSQPSAASLPTEREQIEGVDPSHTPGQPYAFDSSTGKPHGVSEQEWSYLSTRMQSEFPEVSTEEAEVFARMAAEQARTGGP